MDFALSDEQRALRDTVLRFAERELNSGVVERDRAQTFRRDLWQQCAAIGLQGLPVPDEYGGAALDTLSTAIALEALGNGCRDGGLVFSLCAHLLACVVPVWKHGSDAQKSGYLRGLCDGTLVGAHAGTAFDGRHLYQIAEDRIQKIDPQTGRVLATIPAPGGGSDSGLAWAEGSLWVGQYRARRIHQVDPQTGAILRTIESDRFVTGVTWIDAELWHGIWEGDASELRRIDPRTGEVLERVEMPAGVAVSGLESDGGDLFYCGGATSGKVRAVRRPKRERDQPSPSASSAALPPAAAVLTDNVRSTAKRGR